MQTLTNQMSRTVSSWLLRSQVRILSGTQIFSLSHASDILIFFIFTSVSPSSKSTIFHSFITQYDIDIADPSNMQGSCQILSQHMASLSMSYLQLKWIERPPGDCEVIGSNPVRDSDFFFVTCSWHADYFILSVKISRLK